jgi:hypothetical protein
MKPMKIFLFLPFCFAPRALLGLPASRPAQSTDASRPMDAKTATGTATASTEQVLSKSFTLEGAKVWTDTGITLEPGQRVVFTTEGKLRYSDVKPDNEPEGLTRGFKDLLRVLPYNDAGRGALVGKIGDPDIAKPFLIGASNDILAPINGKLSIGINQSNSDTGAGCYTVKITVYAADSSVVREVAKEVPSIAGIDDCLFAKIPRRIGDKEGNRGDMVNFLIIGNEDEMKETFTTAGWVKVDADVKATVLAGALASFSKESYLTMPMSQLYLFDRPQDYSWARAEAVSVVASRNHLRI